MIFISSERIISEVIGMKFNEFNEGMKSYFDTLPKYMQQNIIHSDVDFESLEELKAYSKNVEKKD